tara:strand:+ start:296 stop:526 length:231 start_codon:yes stop_codon:yes gene_type:complete
MINDTVTLISPDGKEKIVCYKFMEGCFRNEGDGDRFSSQNNDSISLEKNMDSYYSYLKKKKIREEKRKRSVSAALN